MYQRLISPSFKRSFFLFGARGTGKSTLVEKWEPQLKPILKIDLLDTEIERSLIINPQSLLNLIPRKAKQGDWIFIDEIQKVPGLLNVVHHLIEKKKFNFLLTGSSARKLKRAGVNLLGGRALDFYLFPLTHLELAEDFNLQSVLTYGQLPLVCNSSDEEDKQDLLRSYVSTYIKQEIKEEQLVRKIEPFLRFLETAAQMNGEILNISKIAVDSGVDSKAIERYFEVLTDTLLGFEVAPFDRSPRRRSSKRSKYYLFDLGVARALAQQLTVGIAPGTSVYGKAFEHFIVLEIYRLSKYLKKDFKFSYLRTKDDLEIDLIVERPGKKLLLIEVKSGERLADTQVNKLSKITADLNPCELMFLTNESKVRYFDHATVYPWRDGIKKIFEELLIGT